MQFDQFIGQVQSRAGLPSRGDALAAVRATLQTLAERLAGGEADHLAAQLPQEFAVYLYRETKAPDPMSLDDFFLRVSRRENVDLPDAVRHAQVVGEVLREAVSPGEIKDVMAQLPAEYGALFQASAGEMQVPREKQGRS